jgi:hypothetical protein
MTLETRLGCAAEIEVIRDRIAPEEPNPCAHLKGKYWYHAMCVKSEKYLRWDERQSIRAQLTAEAEKARRGE